MAASRQSADLLTVLSVCPILIGSLNVVHIQALMAKSQQHITVRPAIEADADECGRICYEGFRAINERHGFNPVFPSVEVATRRMAAFIRHPSVFAVVAESGNGGGGIVGFNFLSERDPVRAIGPIVIDPAVQARGIGRRLMEAVLEHARGARGIRLLQEAYNMQSFSLYASLGFDARELFVVLEGMPKITEPEPKWQIRPLTEADLQECESLHERVHGYPRTNELREALTTMAPDCGYQGRAGLRLFGSADELAGQSRCR